jgi:hypothetical protein
MSYTTKDIENEDIPDEIDPYNFLGVDPGVSPNKCKNVFKKLITSDDKFVKKIAALAYDMICFESYLKKQLSLLNGSDESCKLSDISNYNKEGSIFKVIKKDHFYYTTIGDLDNLTKLYEKEPGILKEKDLFERNLLYISARNGYNHICQFLLEEGMDPNEIQSSESTPLHGAAYYNQYDTIKLLLEYGAKTNLKNFDGNLALQDTKNIKIKEIILQFEKDKITCLLNKLTDQKLGDRLILVKYNNQIIGKKILRNEKLISTDLNINHIKKNWEVGWHGTKFEFLESIMKYGLYPSGSKLENGVEIKPLAGHVKLKTKLAGFDDWAKAIFVSPSIFYAGHPAYARKIMSNNEEYSVLVETRIKPGSFSKHPPTVVKYAQKNGEPTFVEYRIEVKDDSNLIMRIESKNNVIVTGILFAKSDFLKNIKDYYKGEIFVNSKEEHNLFLTKY